MKRSARSNALTKTGERPVADEAAGDPIAVHPEIAVHPDLIETVVTRADSPSTETHATCEALIEALRDELARREEFYDDLVLNRWILEQRYERALSRMRRCDPEGVAWLDEQLGEWQRHVEERQLAGLSDTAKQQKRKMREEEFNQRVELARRASR